MEIKQIYVSSWVTTLLTLQNTNLQKSFLWTFLLDRWSFQSTHLHIFFLLGRDRYLRETWSWRCQSLNGVFETLCPDLPNWHQFYSIEGRLASHCLCLSQKFYLNTPWGPEPMAYLNKCSASEIVPQFEAMSFSLNILKHIYTKFCNYYIIESCFMQADMHNVFGSQPSSF